MFIKPSHPLQLFSLKTSSSSALSSMKLKNLIHTLIVNHMCRFIRALSKVKTIIVNILKNNESNNNYFPYKIKHCNKTKIIMGSFRLHYNWCSSRSSHIMPLPSRVFQELPPSAAGCGVNNSHEDCPESQLAGYLQWLEENIHQDNNIGSIANTSISFSTTTCEHVEINEIDVLAEMFIANCHENFRLEKQESERKFQEMLSRSL